MQLKGKLFENLMAQAESMVSPVNVSAEIMREGRVHYRVAESGRAFCGIWSGRLFTSDLLKVSCGLCKRALAREGSGYHLAKS